LRDYGQVDLLCFWSPIWIQNGDNIKDYTDWLLTRHEEKFCSLITSHIVFVNHSTYNGSLLLVNVIGWW